MSISTSSISLTRRGTTVFLRDLLKLSKYRLSGLVAFTAGVGYACRHDTNKTETLSPFSKGSYYRQLMFTTAGTWLSAACANTLNQIYEYRSDALMNRTRLRPLPSGRLGLAQALIFATTTGISGITLLLHETNPTAAALAAANILLYAGVYTPLKRISTINTWIGSIVGAIPPMLGWSAASNGRLCSHDETGAWLLGSLLFLWQIPHFHALAVVSRIDYSAAKLRMLAVSDPVANAWWARQMAWAMVPLGGLFVSTGMVDTPFAIESALLAGWMVKGSGSLMKDPISVQAARPLFRASIVHLPVTLGLLLAHRVPIDEMKEMKNREMMEQLEWERRRTREVRFHQPWEVFAPFPFLPVPCGVPAVVLEMEDKDCV